MKKLFFILTTLFFSSNLFAQIPCPNKFPMPKINIYTSYGKLKYNNQYNNSQITQISKNNNVLEKGIFASGLSILSINYDINIKTVGQPFTKNTYCVYPEAINFSIYYKNPTIFISNQLKKNSCEYKIVLRHEQAHMQINKTALDYFLPLFYNAIEKISSNISPIQINNITQLKKASDKLTLEYSNKVDILFEYFKQQINKEQKKLDNPANYKYESTLCK